MYNELRSKVMQASDSYVTIPYILAIPKGRKMSPFERLYKPFRYIIWSCFSSSLIFAVLFIYYLRFLGKSNIMDFVYGYRNRIPFTNLLSTLFGGPTLTRLPYKTFARYILVVWMLYTFVLRSAYSAELFKLLQDGRARTSMSSFREVIDNNYTIYAFPAVERVVKLAAPDANTALVDAKNPTSKLFQRISSATNGDKIALCLLEWSILSYNQENPNERVDILEQPLISAPIVFYMPRHTFLRHATQQLIFRILASGLVKRFESYYLYATTHSSSVKREPVKLSIWLLFGIFSVYAIFLVICLIIFGLEVASFKSKLCRTVIDFLNF